MEVRSYQLKVNLGDIVSALHEKPGFFLLESSLRDRQRGRYSFFGYDPFFVVEGGDLRDFAKLREFFADFNHNKKSVLTPFPAGIAGFLSYDFGMKFEDMKSRHREKAGIPGFFFGFYDRVITIDHFERRMIITSTGLPEKNALLRKKRAVSRLKELDAIVVGLQNDVFRYAKAKNPPRYQSNFTQTGYCNAVEKVLDYIKSGDIYQANLAQEFLFDVLGKVDTAILYRALCAFSPSCFGGYLNAGGFQIVSSSPEMFLSLKDGVVRTRPMKGTRPRGRTLSEDRQKNRELRNNIKEKAELLMVTDLERNDLGRVCDFGSIRVEQIRVIEKYRTVYQATATVSGRLMTGKDGFDVIAACFPSGSVTGCPKIRSMEIIDKLERSRRGIYTGALGYMSFSGDMAFNVLIRTILVQGKKISFHVGSGIVADSVPRSEYEETLVKAQAMRDSLGVVVQ